MGKVTHIITCPFPKKLTVCNKECLDCNALSGRQVNLTVLCCDVCHHYVYYVDLPPNFDTPCHVNCR